MLINLGLDKEIWHKLNSAVSLLNWHSNDLVSEECTNLKRKTIWIPDWHDGDRIDISTTLVYLGHDPVLAGYKKNRSPFPKKLALARQAKRLSRFVQTVGVNIESISELQIKENYEFYKNDTDFTEVDAVICSFPSSMCEAFIPLNKSIIFNPAHRYNMNRCTEKLWKNMNRNYDLLEAKSKLFPAAASQYDLEYQYHYSGYK